MSNTTAQNIATKNAEFKTYPKKKLEGEKWPALEGAEDERLASIFEPIRLLSPAEGDNELREMANLHAKDPHKIYMALLNSNLKKYSKYGKMEENSAVRLALIQDTHMPQSTYSFTRSSQIVGHETIIHEGRVWVALMAHTVKQCRYKTTPYFLTSLELHVFDMNDKGKPVKCVEIAASLGKTYPAQTNTVHWKDNLYYFKRHMTFEDAEVGGFRRVKDARRQLTRLNLTDLTETEVAGYSVEEGTERQAVLFLDTSCDNYVVYAYQTASGFLQIRRYRDVTEARKAGQKLLYQGYLDVCVVDVGRGERIWITKPPGAKSLAVARARGILEPGCARHECSHKQWGQTTRTGACESGPEGLCEKRFLEQQYICTYSTKYRDQEGKKQAAYYAAEAEDQQKTTLDVYSMKDLSTTIKSYQYQGGLAGLGGVVERRVNETGDAQEPIELELRFELFHGHEIETFKYYPHSNAVSEEHNYKRLDEEYAGSFTCQLHVAEATLAAGKFKYFVDWDGCAILCLLDRSTMSPAKESKICAEIESQIGSSGGQGIVMHRVTHDRHSKTTQRYWRGWQDFKEQFVGMMNFPHLIIATPFETSFIHLASTQMIINTLHRPRRVATQWERLEGSADLGEVQKYVLERKKALLRGRMALNGCYRRVTAEGVKVCGQRSNAVGGGSGRLDVLAKDAQDRAVQFFVEEPTGGAYTRVWHKSGTLLGQGVSDSHYVFAFYNGNFGFVRRSHKQILELAPGAVIYPPGQAVGEHKETLYLYEREAEKFSFDTTYSKTAVKFEYDLTLETVTDTSYKSDYLPFIINQRTQGKYFLTFYNFSDPSKPFITQKLGRGGDLARVSTTYKISEYTRGTKFVVCAQYEPFDITTYEFVEDIRGTVKPYIQLASLRSLRLSPALKKVYQDPGMICIPYFNRFDDQIKGAQLIVLNQENGWKAKAAIHCELSSEATANLQYEGRLFRLGTSKVIPEDQTSPDQYFTLVESSIQGSISKGGLFERTEVEVMLEKIHKTQFSQIPFGMENQILHDNSELTRGALFSNQEILSGKCKADMYLQNPKAAVEEFESGQEAFNPYIKPFDESITYDQADADYNLCTALDRSFTIGTEKVQSRIISRLFQMENRKTSKFCVMRSLPAIIDMPSPPPEITTFFQSGFDADENGPILSIEDPFHDKEAPLESKLQSSHFTLLEIPSTEFEFNARILETLQSKFKDQEAKVIMDSGEDRFDVQHCTVNFIVPIIGNKLAVIFGDGDEANAARACKMDNLYLSELIQELQDTPEVFLGQASMNIIDLQNTEAHAYFVKLFKVYLGFFLLPFLTMHAFHEAETGEVGYWLQVICITVGLATQFLFFGIECIQLHGAGSLSKYLSADPWNVQELLQFVLYVVWYCVEIFGGINNPKAETVAGTLLTLVVLVQAFLKVLFFLRLYEGLGSLVQMLITTVKELVNFTTFLLISVTFFAFSFRVLGVNFSADDYANVPGFVVTFMTTYRNSIGDIQAPGYAKWDSDSNPDLGRWNRDAIVGTIWTVWLFNSFVNLIILLNFLIAVISQVYDSVIATQQFCSYAYKSDFNREYFIVMRYFDAVPEFKILIQTHDINLDTSEGPDASLGFVKSIQNQILATFEDTKLEMAKYQVKQHAALTMKVMEVKSTFTHEVKTVRTELAEVKSELTAMLKDIKDKLDQRQQIAQ